MSELEFAQAVEPPAGASGPSISLSEEKEAEYSRIMRNLQEHTGGEIIRKVLADGEVVRAYWGQCFYGSLSWIQCAVLTRQDPPSRDGVSLLKPQLDSSTDG